MNLCVRNFEFYSKWFDTPVFDANYRLYVLFLLCNLKLAYLFVSGAVWHFQALSGASWWMYFADFLDDNFVWWQKAITAFNVVMLVGFLVDLYVQVVCVSCNLTYDELFRPQFYPYLYRKEEGKLPVFVNPADKGLVNNWKLFLRKMIRI